MFISLPCSLQPAGRLRLGMLKAVIAFGALCLLYMYWSSVGEPNGNDASGKVREGY